MRGRSRTGWPLAVVLVVASACGSPVSSGAPGTDGATTGTASAPAPQDSAAAEVGPLPGTTDAFDPSPAGMEALRAAALADRASQREHAGMVAYLGPDSTALAAALDRQSSDLLASMVTAAQARTPVELASTRLSLVAPAPISGSGLLPGPGQLAAGTWIGAAALLDTSFGKGGYDKSSTSTDDVAIGPNKGSIKTTTAVTVTPSGSKISINIEATTSGSVSDATGKLLFRINGKSHAHIDAEGCPDSGGLAPAHVDTADQEDYFAGGDGGSIGQSWSSTDSGEIRIQANDAAQVDRIEMDMKGSDAIKGGKRAAGAGQSDLDAWSVAVAGTWSAGPDMVTNATADRRVTAKDGSTRQNATDTWRSMFTTVSLIAYTASKAAERFWQSGKCVEVVVDPTGGDVDDDSTTTVTAKVRHRFEGNELDKPVEATVSGVKSIEPSGQKVPSPASFTYTAGPNEGDSGDITFKSVSNRGIGQTTVTFKVGAKALKVAISGKMTTSGFGVSFVTKLDVADLVLTRQPDGTYLGSAPATAQVILAIPGCTKPYTQKGTFKLGATRAGGVDRTWTLAWDPSTTFNFTGGACLGASIESFTGSGSTGPVAGFMFVLGPLELPAAGGSLHVAHTTTLGQSSSVIDATVIGKVVAPPGP